MIVQLSSILAQIIKGKTKIELKIKLGYALTILSGAAGEGRAVGVPKFHSWGKCTMPLTNINSDWM